MIKTGMMRIYIFKFIFRLTVFLLTLFFYISDKAMIIRLMSQPVWLGITPIHLLWLVFVAIMLAHIFPVKRLTMALGKSREQHYVEHKDYSELELLRYVQKQNIRAWHVMLFWLSFNAIFGLLYLMEIIGNADLLMLTVFYFLCDYICILFFCPFQTGIMKNKCCVNCRIYDWGHFMMFTPMLFIRNFFSWSLFFTSIVVLLRWEVTYAKHPERFWSGSNETLECKNCKDKTCQIKNQIAHKPTPNCNDKNIDSKEQINARKNIN